MEKKRLVQIVVPAVILIIIASIWWTKSSNSKSKPPVDDSWPPLEITTVDLEEIKGKGLPVMISFGSDSCIPCRQMAPALKKIYGEMRGKAVIHYMDVWKYPDAGRVFPLQVIPTQFFFTANGEPYRPSEELAEKIPFIMYKTKDPDEHIFTAHEGGLTADQMRAILIDMGVTQ